MTVRHTPRPIVLQEFPDAYDLVSGALYDDRVKLAFQPVYSTEDGAPVSFHECLVRIETVDGRIITPAAFMPDIEDHDLGRRLDRTVLHKVLMILEAVPNVRLSLNLSPLGMMDMEWMDILTRFCARRPGLGDRLIIEVTETSAMLNPLITNHFMTSVRELGCSFALDDFGAGHTAFRYFRDFRFDIVKIDGGFIRGIETSPDNQMLVKALVLIANHFELLTVAEFVENKAASETLETLGITCQQGYYFSPPQLSPDWLPAKLKTS